MGQATKKCALIGSWKKDGGELTPMADANSPSLKLIKRLTNRQAGRRRKSLRLRCKQGRKDISGQETYERQVDEKLVGDETQYFIKLNFS